MSGRTREDGGQATVELALVLPLVCLMMLAIVQVGLVIHAHLLVVHAAREGVRAAAVDTHPLAAHVAVVAGAPLDPDRLDVEVSDAGDGRVRVEVRYRYETSVPLVGALFGDVDLSAVAVMRRETQ
ncbi:MAG: TadE/TadG family type IV pilus assembly protein [Acidimicrobiales bacterium]